MENGLKYVWYGVDLIVRYNDLTLFEQLHPLSRLLGMLVTSNMMHNCFSILTNKHENKDNIRWKNQPMEAIQYSPSIQSDDFILQCPL